MSDIYEGVATKFKNSPSAVILFSLGLIMLVSGIWLFVEDTTSSKLGLERLQTEHGMNVQIYPNTYWVMSLAPQIASMVFFYIFTSDTRKKWALLVSLFCQAVDFGTDAYYRSNDQFLIDPTVTVLSSLITLFFFSVGSEVFITIGVGLVLKLFAPAIQVFGVNLDDIKRAFRRQYRGSNSYSDTTSMPNRPSIPTMPSMPSGPYRSSQSKKSSHRPSPFPGPDDFLGGA